MNVSEQDYATVATIARNAAALAWERMVHWAHHLTSAAVDAKGDPNNLVTAADAEIQSIVAGYIRHVRPQDTVVGEEQVEPRAFTDPTVATLVPVPASGTEIRCEWHVDPIDGTVNFVRGIEHYAFSVGVRLVDVSDAACPGDAAVPGGHWLAGLVAAPALNTTWFAGHGRGAWMVTGLPASMSDPAGDLAQGPTPVRLTGTPPSGRGAVVATGFGYAKERRDAQLRALSAVMERFDDVRRMGSAAIDLCQVAQGRVNAYFERGLGVYDWAAGALIAREAGCYVDVPVVGAGALPPQNPLIVAADTQERFDFLRANG